MGRGSERKVPHIGTEIRSKLLREAAVRNIGQWANSVPAAAVIRKVRALSGIIGFKGSAGGSVSQLLNIRAQLCYAVETIFLEYAQGWRNSGCSGEMLRYPEELRSRRQPSGA